MAAFFVGIMRKKSRLKLFCIGVDLLFSVHIVPQHAQLLVRAKGQMPVAKAAVQGCGLRGRVQVECNVRFVFMTGFWYFALMSLVVLCPQRGLKARHGAERPGFKTALRLPGEMACLYQLIAVLLVFFTRQGFLLREPEPTLYPSQFDAVLGLAFLPGAKGANCKGLRMGSVHRIAVAVEVLGVESAVGSDIVKARATAVQAVLPA